MRSSFIILMLLITVTVGCTRKMYNENLPGEQIAVLVQNYKFDENHWTICSVDSEKFYWRNKDDKFKLLPGFHTLEVEYRNPLSASNLSDKKLHRVFFEVKAGHIYELTHKLVAIDSLSIEEFEKEFGESLDFKDIIGGFSGEITYKLVVEDITDEYKKN